MEGRPGTPERVPTYPFPSRSEGAPAARRAARAQAACQRTGGAGSPTAWRSGTTPVQEGTLLTNRNNSSPARRALPHPPERRRCGCPPDQEAPQRSEWGRRGRGGPRRVGALGGRERGLVGRARPRATPAPGSGGKEVGARRPLGLGRGGGGPEVPQDGRGSGARAGRPASGASYNFMIVPFCTERLSQRPIPLAER